jgi:copper chaperone CopZ
MRRARGDKAGWLTNRFSISGMHCKDCAKGLTAELKLTPGVVKAVVSFTETLATVVYDSKRVESSALLKAIQEAGFRGTLITNVPASGAVVKTVAGSEPAAKVSPETGLP